jgi:hypothetical protein
MIVGFDPGLWFGSLQIGSRAAHLLHQRWSSSKLEHFRKREEKYCYKNALGYRGISVIV